METDDSFYTETGRPKLRSDSTWANLTPEQRDSLESWLFVENLGYAEVLERARKEFGLNSSLPSLARFRRRLSVERTHRESLGMDDILRQVVDADLPSEKLTSAAMNLAAKQLLLCAIESPHKTKEFARFARVLFAHQQQHTRQSWLNIARCKFEFDAATATLIHHLKIQEHIDDESLSDEQKIRKIREDMFGPENLPD